MQKKFAGIALAFTLPSILTQLYLLNESNTPYAHADRGGILSSILVNLSLFMILWTAKRLWRYFPILPFLLLNTLALYANYENISTLGAPLDFYYFKYLQDETFIKGSFEITNMPLFIALYILTLGLYALKIHTRQIDYIVGIKMGRFWGYTWRNLFTLLIICVCAFYTLRCPPIRHIASWRQFHYLQINLMDILHQMIPDQRLASQQKNPEKNVRYQLPVDLPTEKRREIDQTHQADLSGQPLIPMGKKWNVLLILVEAASGAYFKKLTQPYHQADNYNLTRLNKHLTHGLFYRNFISQQRQTNRGEYAVICGDFPNLGHKDAKMDIIARTNKKKGDCLPQILTNAGYNTVYLQAAPIAFMSKDLFMAHAGFQEIYGMNWFKSAYRWNGWGLDDLAYFEQSIDKIEDLGKAAHPWFMMMLTSGTHHPYNVPSSWKNKLGIHAARHAFDYLDHGLQKFLRQLEAKKILSNTLVIISTDESAGIHHSDNVSQILSQNWGPLIILPPDFSGTRYIDEIFMQSDLAVGILDYLGITQGLDAIGGRSPFRTYPTERPLMFANTYSHNVFMLKKRDLTICHYRLDQCDHFTKNNDHFLSSAYQSRPARKYEVDQLRYFLAKNEHNMDHNDQLPQEMNLSGVKVFQVSSQSFQRKIFGWQFLTIPPETTLEVITHIQVREGPILLWQKLVDRKGKSALYSSKPVQVKANEKVFFSYTYHAKNKYKDVEIILYAKNTSGKVVKLVIDQAKMYSKAEILAFDGVMSQKVTIQ